MIPTRYLGPIHALGLTFREEGVRGLYRGYTAYLLATAIYLLVVPIACEIGLGKSFYSGIWKDDTDDLY
jgi:hypothetical protein